MTPGAAATGAGAAPAGGVYVHYPYCAHRCFYCDFNVVTPPRVPARAYTDAVLAELCGRAGDLEGPARSLYVGGGTPSLWPPELLAEVVAAVTASPGLIAGAEVTVEANPADVSPEWIAGALAAGVNRVSLGVQALQDPLLRAVDRRHDLREALAALERVLAAPFRSVSFDLMFGLPGQTPEAWREDLARAAELGAPHLSIYNLTVEPGTPLAVQVRKGRVTLPDDGAQADMLFATRDVLSAQGYGHYEVSSYARPGHEAVHNSGYWELRPYLGLGAGAHGFARGERWSNVRRPTDYMAAARDTGRPTAERERPDPETLAFERLMTGLRRLDVGVAWGDDLAPFEPGVAREVDRGRLAWRDGARDGTARRLKLTEDGLRFMNDVLLELMPG